MAEAAPLPVRKPPPLAGSCTRSRKARASSATRVSTRRTAQRRASTSSTAGREQQGADDHPRAS
eukprot:485090-Prymnesium_polylepis.1